MVATNISCEQVILPLRGDSSKLFPKVILLLHLYLQVSNSSISVVRADTCKQIKLSVSCNDNTNRQGSCALTVTPRLSCTFTHSHLPTTPWHHDSPELTDKGAVL